MKKILLGLALLGVAGSVHAGMKGSRPYKDSWGHSYKNQDTLYKDTDHDGTINKYDYNDRGSRIQTKQQSDWYKPSKKNWWESE